MFSLLCVYSLAHCEVSVSLCLVFLEVILILSVRSSECARMEKVNADLLIITYGSIVTQLIRDIEDLDEVNKELEKMGYNIGVCLVLPEMNEALRRTSKSLVPLLVV